MPNLPDLNLGLRQVNIGFGPNDGQGDDLRTSFEKFNYNMHILAGTVGDKLTANREYYVGPGGSDTNDGLSLAAAFRTVSKAINVIYEELDLNGSQVIINLIPGDYTETVEISGLPEGAYGVSPAIVIRRVPATSGSITWTVNPAVQRVALSILNRTSVEINDISFQSATVSTVGDRHFIEVLQGARLQIGSNIDFGIIGADTQTLCAHLYVSASNVQIAQPYTIRGGARTHIFATDRAVVSVLPAASDPKICQVVGTPYFLNFVEVRNRSDVNLDGSLIRYSTNLMGRQFAVEFLSSIAFGTNTFPGTLTPGIYENAQILNNLTFTGLSTFSGTLSTQGQLAVGGPMAVAGDAAFNKSVTFTGAVQIAQGGSLQLPQPAPTANGNDAATTQFVQQVVQAKILGATPLATPSLYGLVKIDAVASDPVIYLKSSVDTLLNQKANLSSPVFTGVARLQAPPALTDNSNAIASTSYVQGAIGQLTVIPPGTMLPYAGSSTSVPNGWLPCDGTIVSRASYPALFAAIGTSWGSTDSTNFQLPDLRDRMPMGFGSGGKLGTYSGAASVTLAVNNLPAHTHPVVDPGHAHSIYDPGHSHGVNDPGHSHGVNDPGHSHGVSDPGHVHSFVVGMAGTDSGTGPLSANSNGPFESNYSGSTYGAATGIGIYPSGTGVSIQGNGTGVGVYASGTGITLQNTGSGVGFSVINPHARVNFIIKT